MTKTKISENGETIKIGKIDYPKISTSRLKAFLDLWLSVEKKEVPAGTIKLPEFISVFGEVIELRKENIELKDRLSVLGR